MNKDLLIIIMFFAIIYLFYEINNLKNKKIENFDAATDASITTAVKKIYLADVEAIRLLSNFAIQLSQGGMTIPGNVNFTGDISSKTIKIGTWTIRELGTHLQFIKDGTVYNNNYDLIKADTGFFAFAQDGNIYTNKTSGKGWLCDLKINKTSSDTLTCKAINITG